MNNCSHFFVEDWAGITAEKTVACAECAECGLSLPLDDDEVVQAIMEDRFIRHTHPDYVDMMTTALNTVESRTIRLEADQWKRAGFCVPLPPTQFVEQSEKPAGVPWWRRLLNRVRFWRTIA